MKRNPVQTLLLEIFTCGLYTLYLIYQLSSEIDDLCNEQMNNGAMELLLTLITCGIYGVYWFYKVGRQIETFQEDYGIRKNSISLINPILAVFGFGYVAMPILISEMNRCIDEKEH